ncbi:hypothetical protein JST97_19990 [bacterium]|nr:hypothetical protein [bacterium]
MTGAVNAKVSTGMGYQRSAAHGQGKVVAETFQKAAQAARGYQPSADIAQIGLQTVAGQHGATQGEQLVAQVVLNQAAQAQKALTKRALKDGAQGSRCRILSEGLGYIAAGGVANGPLGVVLADLGNRQMDLTRAQSYATPSLSDIRDSNVVGMNMLQQISAHVDDPNVQFITGNALSQMGQRYHKCEGSDQLDSHVEVLYQDAEKLHQTFDAIKVVAGAGDAQNPKILAMMTGNLSPSRSGGSYSVGRPGGGYAEYTSPGDGFGVTRPSQPFRRD